MIFIECEKDRSR